MSTSTTPQLFRSRLFGPDGVPRSLGKPAAAFPARVATDADMAIAVDRQQTRLALPMAATDASMTVVDPSPIAAYSLLSIDAEIVQATGAPSGNVVPVSRGFDGTTAAVHLASAAVTGFIDAYHHNRVVAEIEAIEAALGPNLGNTATGIVQSAPFNFAAQQPGGSLAAGSNVITLNPVPRGIAVGSYLYISGGTGAAEGVPVTGWNASTGQVIVTCANSHTGAWTIGSATGGIQEAICSLPAAGGEVKISDGVWTLQSKIVIPGNGNVPRIAIDGGGATLIRGTAYPAGDLIYHDGSSATASISIRDLQIYAAGVYGSWLNVTSGAAIHLYRSQGANHVIQNVRVNDGYIGFHVEGTQQVEIQNPNYYQQNMSPATIPLTGILINGTSTAGAVPNSITVRGGVITTNGATSPNAITAGILVQNVDGLLVSDIHIGGGPQTGILFQGIDSSLIANIYIVHVLIDIPRVYGIRVSQLSGTANFVGAITIADSHINGENYLFPANSTVDGVRLETGSNYLIASNQISNFGANGIQLLSAGAINYVKIASNLICDNNFANSAAIAGVNVNATGGSGIAITGNNIRNTTANGHQKFGIVFNGAASEVTISANALAGNETAAIQLYTPPTELVIGANGGWSNLVPSIASGASVAAPPSDAATITGTTPISTITGGWAGRQLTLIFTNAAPGGLVTGGNIARAQTAAQNQAVRLTFDGTNWF